ncbi:hypothetical protein L6164_015261 [Bauhinia variegata]|uniref:Uncharacterized protein n=1 Tax=Bauhinia variegata TaxID=167791 RepID=A0ACB9NK59_BAUVA|nr:hypothetical protein L6164_015261 [Bauhinia variegata]
MMGSLIFEEKKHLLEVAKADLVLGSKHREASIIKWNLEHAENELADFKACFECLSRKSSYGEDQATSKDSEKRNGRRREFGNKFIAKIAEEKSSKKDEREKRRLKQEYEKVALEKSSEELKLLTTVGNKSSKSRSNISLKKATSALHALVSAKESEKGNRSLRKRKEAPIIPLSETPKLFSSNFKVPKLKNPSPGVR